MRGAALIGFLDPYDVFVEQIIQRASNPVVKSFADTISVAESFRVQLSSGAGFAGTMTGSSWSPRVRPGSGLARVIQHAMPSLAVAEAQRAANRQIFISVTTTSNGAANSLNRNSYTSAADASSATSLIVDELLYFTDAGVMRMVPWLQLGPSPFTF